MRLECPYSKLAFVFSDAGPHHLIPPRSLQVLTGRQPFGRTSDGGVVKKVIDGARPERPNSGFSDGLWNLLQLSCSEEHESQESKRPSIVFIMEQLQKDSSSWFAMFPFPTTAPKRWPFSKLMLIGRSSIRDRES